MNTFNQVEHHVEIKQTEIMNLQDKYEQIIQDLQDKQNNLERFKDAHSRNE